MNTRIYYLRFRSNFKTPLRSDSLWGTLCWAIRMVSGKEVLSDILEDYEQGGEKAFFISSAFPFYELDDKKHIFFPRPVLPYPSTEQMLGKKLEEKKLKLREKKRKDKSGWLHKDLFEYVIDKSTTPPKSIFEAPNVQHTLVTHNTIDRLQGSTLSIGDNGQLFHTDEYTITAAANGKAIQRTGMYFLARGNTEVVEAALRFLQHYGIGGDRTTGKGSFVFESKSFELNEPKDANAVMTLSLFHPSSTEIDQIKKSKPGFLNYKLTVRQGRGSFAFNPNKSKKADGTNKIEKVKKEVMMFEEGSVFPLGDGLLLQGQNPVVQKHPAGFDIFHYGHAFMVKLKVL